MDLMTLRNAKLLTHLALVGTESRAWTAWIALSVCRINRSCPVTGSRLVCGATTSVLACPERRVNGSTHPPSNQEDRRNCCESPAPGPPQPAPVGSLSCHAALSAYCQPVITISSAAEYRPFRPGLRPRGAVLSRR